MEGLVENVLASTAGLPEGVPLGPKDLLLHLESGAANTRRCRVWRGRGDCYAPAWEFICVRSRPLQHAHAEF